MVLDSAETYPRLLGDVGGTNARFALETGPHEVAQVAVLSTRDYPSLEAAMRAYLERCGELGAQVRHAAVGIANPIYRDHVQMTNHSWHFSIAAMRRALGLTTFLVINDFTALAYALPQLPQGDLEQIGGGSVEHRSPRVLVGAGTGLGVSGLIPSGNGWVALAGEGGHVSFAPVDDEQVALWAFARERYGRVSAERLLSGAGLELIYEFLRGRAPADAGPLKRSAPEITAGALDGDESLSTHAVDLFCGLLGTVASDLALVLGARGGVYIGGGIIPRLGPVFARSPFRRRFEDKGRFAEYLAGVPTFVIRTSLPALGGLSAALSHHLTEAPLAQPPDNDAVEGGTAG